MTAFLHLVVADAGQFHYLYSNPGEGEVNLTRTNIATTTLVATLVLAGCADKDSSDTELEPRSPWDIDSVIGVSNMDDDDENGSPDWDDAGAEGDNDLAAL